MFKISISHSLTSDAKVSAMAMAAHALQELGACAPTAALLFSTFGNDHSGLLKELVQLLPGCPIVGGSSNGEVSREQGYRVGSSVLIVFASDTITIRAGVLRGLTFDDEAQNLEMALQQWRAQGVAYQPGKGKSPGLPVLGLLFPDGLGLDGGSIVRLFSDYFAGTRFFGGASAENFTLTQTVQFFNDEVLHNAVPYLLFYGPLRCHWSVTEGLGSGWRAVGERMDARCDGKFIQTIAQKPAVEYLASRYRLQGGQLSVYHPFVIYPDRNSTEHYLRDVIRYCEETGHLESVQILPTDCQIQLTQPYATDILAVSRKNIHEALAHFPCTEVPVAALWFSCVSRALVLEHNAADEFNTATETIPSCLPVAGFYTYGEIAPSKLLDQNAYHGSTLVTLLLGEEPLTDTGIFDQHHQFSATNLAQDNQAPCQALTARQAEIQSLQREMPVESQPEVLSSTLPQVQGEAYILIHDTLKGLSVHRGVRDFLLTVWSDVLALTMMYHGYHHANTLAMQKAANELLWISGAKTTQRKRSRVINDVKLLMQQLRVGMTLIGLTVEQQKSHLDVISKPIEHAFLAVSVNSKLDKTIPPKPLDKPAKSHTQAQLSVHNVDMKGLHMTEIDEPPDSVWHMFEDSNAKPPDVNDPSDAFPELDMFEESKNDPPAVDDQSDEFPMHLLEQYPHIKEKIINCWGTVELGNYLSLILENNRDKVRSGFPLDVATLLLKLYNKNIKFFDSKNIPTKDYDFLSQLKWKLPKNF